MQSILKFTYFDTGNTMYVEATIMLTPCHALFVCTTLWGDNVLQGIINITVTSYINHMNTM